MIKAISMDFWSTLAEYNPEYRRKLCLYFSEIFDLPVEDATKKYKTLKDGLDRQAEVFGTAVTPLVAAKMLIESATHSVTATEVHDKIHSLVEEHPPFLNENVIPTFEMLRDMGYTIGISSNTNFIGGRFLSNLLNIPVDFAIYSDEIGISKPHAEFFHTMMSRVRSIRGEDLNIDEFVHIGDSSICDVKGALRVGIEPIKISDPEHTVEILNKRFILNKRLAKKKKEPA